MQRLKNMKSLVFFFTLFIISMAERQDLTGKMFTFPVESNTVHVSLKPEQNKPFTAVTACLRFFSDLQRPHSLFSLSIPSSDNAFLIFKRKEANQYAVWANGGETVFKGLEYKLNAWNSVCATWDSLTGIAQLWINGNPSSRRKAKAGVSINGTPKIILGQEQDKYGGGFDASQSFVGMLTDVHMWDSVLSPKDIWYYTEDFQVTPGNVLNWGSLEFSKHLEVVIESLETSKNGAYSVQSSKLAQ
ncbi:serum amyloid P-component [Chanos chanos]|uniref:Pentraxin family member n=1 Tax=Chanos chanos TaxID=29144 RepID=A0A6J2V849_CHACN|nr:serum amyloid P-component-like [Chanos chanos]